MKRHIYQRTVLESFYCLLRVSIWFVSMYPNIYIPKITQGFLGWKRVTDIESVRSPALDHLPKGGVRAQKTSAELYSSDADTAIESRLPHWRKPRSGCPTPLSLKTLLRWVWKQYSSLCDLILRCGIVLHPPRPTREKTSTAFVPFACLVTLFLFKKIFVVITWKFHLCIQCIIIICPPFSFLQLLDPIHHISRLSSGLLYLLFKYFILLHVHECLIAFMSMHHIHAWCHGSQKRALHALELELWL